MSVHIHFLIPKSSHLFMPRDSPLEIFVSYFISSWVNSTFKFITINLCRSCFSILICFIYGLKAKIKCLKCLFSDQSLSIIKINVCWSNTQKCKMLWILQINWDLRSIGKTARIVIGKNYLMKQNKNRNEKVRDEIC